MVYQGKPNMVGKALIEGIEEDLDASYSDTSLDGGSVSSPPKGIVTVCRR